MIGDLAALSQDGTAVPGTAPAAIQGGWHAAASIRRALRGKLHESRVEGSSAAAAAEGEESRHPEFHDEDGGASAMMRSF